MKHTRILAAALLLIFGAVAASAQSLGDYARANRATKAASHSKTSHHYDNDNLPRDTKLSVVGNETVANAQTADSKQSGEAKQSADASANTNSATGADGAKPAEANAAEGTKASTTAETKDPKESKTTAADDQKKANEELQKKISSQQQKIDSLNRDLDLTQREYKLRAASFYADAGERLRNSAQWDKDDTNYKQQIEEKRKALDSAKSQMETMQEQARRAGIRPKEDRPKDEQ